LENRFLNFPGAAPDTYIGRPAILTRCFSCNLLFEATSNNKSRKQIALFQPMIPDREGRTYEKDRGNINCCSSSVSNDIGNCVRRRRERIPPWQGRSSSRSLLADYLANRRRTGHPCGRHRNRSEHRSATSGLCSTTGTGLFRAGILCAWTILCAESLCSTKGILCTERVLSL
jgi:hypothetical protein